MSRHSKIVDAIGRAKMSARLGVGETAISNAVARERFPASWYLVVVNMCADVGLECPASLFGMKPLDSSHIVSNRGKSQPTVANPATMGAE